MAAGRLVKGKLGKVDMEKFELELEEGTVARCSINTQRWDHAQAISMQRGAAACWNCEQQGTSQQQRRTSQLEARILSSLLVHAYAATPGCRQPHRALDRLASTCLYANHSLQLYTSPGPTPGLRWCL